MIQAKLKQVIAEAPEDVQEAYKGFVEEAMHIATAKDLDVLLASLKGDKSDLLLQAVEQVTDEVASQAAAQQEQALPEESKASEVQEELKAEEPKSIADASSALTSSAFIQPAETPV